MVAIASVRGCHVAIACALIGTNCDKRYGESQPALQRLPGVRLPLDITLLVGEKLCRVNNLNNLYTPGIEKIVPRNYTPGIEKIVPRK